MLRFTRNRVSGLRAVLALAVPLLSLTLPAEAGGWGGHGGYGYGGWGGYGWGGGWHGGTRFGLSLSLPLTFGYPYPYRYPYPYPYAYAPPPVVVLPAPSTATSPIYLAPSGRTCREFETRGSVDGRAVPLRGIACLDPDGRWRVAR